MGLGDTGVLVAANLRTGLDVTAVGTRPALVSGQELGNSPEAAAEVTKFVCEAVKIPVFVKLTSEAVSIVDVASKPNARRYGSCWSSSIPAARQADRTSGWSLSDSTSDRIVRFFRNDNLRVPKW